MMADEIRECPVCHVKSPGGRTHASGHIETIDGESPALVAASDVASYIEGYRGHRALHATDIHAVWVNGEDEPRTLTVGALSLLVGVVRAAQPLIEYAHEQYMLDGDTESELNRRLIALAEALAT